MIKTARVLAMVFLSMSFLLGGGSLWAQESTQGDDEKTVTNYRGLQFNVPKDWPIEKVGNTIGPISVEDYMSRKFKELSTRLEKQEEELASVAKRLEVVERRKHLNA